MRLEQRLDRIATRLPRLKTHALQCDGERGSLICFGDIGLPADEFRRRYPHQPVLTIAELTDAEIDAHLDEGGPEERAFLASLTDEELDAEIRKREALAWADAMQAQEEVHEQVR